jgi:hypothetical protein
MMRLFLLDIVLIFCICAGCNLPHKSRSRELIIFLEKTPCMGYCPVYTISLYEDGTVIYAGKKNVNLLGSFKASIPHNRLKHLQDAFLKAGFLEMKDSYRSLLKDLPTTYISFTSQGQTKKIMDYDGAPEKLKDLEKQVTALVDELKWKRLAE